MSKTSTAMETRRAEEIVHQYWGMVASAKRLAGEEDKNFLIQAENGQLYILKIATSVERQRLEFQNRMLAHLLQAELDIQTPQLFATLAGEEILDLQTGELTGLARLLSFLPGTLWVETKQTLHTLYRDLGTHLAALDRALADWTDPSAEQDLDWDLRHALRQRPHVTAIEDAKHQDIAEQIFHRFAACVVPRFPALRRSVIHNDANDHNLLVEDDQLTGLFDFGDAVKTFTVCELAIALAYALLDAEDPLEAACEVVAAYHDSYPLEDAELDVLFHLLLARLAVSVTIAARRSQGEPDNPYLFVTQAPAWALLEKLAPLDPQAVTDRFYEACGKAVIRPHSATALIEKRQRHIGPSLSVSYRDPLSIVRGRGQYFYSDRGRPYLDLVNNVCHVGHCHPKVVEAGSRQMAILNTNTRYLYDGLTHYAERLCATLPEALEVCYFVTSGSEANELALRLARTATGRRDLLVVEGAYHGHTGGLIDISPYKFRGPGGSGEPPAHVHVVPVADGYRGEFKGQGRETGALYAAEVGRILQQIDAPIGAFISESLLGCGGQIIPPEGYFEEVYRQVRAAGGVCIADEVQVGFGRVGTHFWAFEPQNVVPDIVVLGKPIGNGHPMAAVITTREIADAFDNGMEFFSTFGGNPVSCAIGLAVLDVIEEEGLQARAHELGERMMSGFRDLQERHPLIGDVRGLGLFIGIELVRDRQTLEPAAEEATEVINRMRERGILLSTDGPLHNVIKIKPPMVLNEGDVDFVVRSLDRVLEAIPPPGA